MHEFSFADCNPVMWLCSHNDVLKMGGILWEISMGISWQSTVITVILFLWVEPVSSNSLNVCSLLNYKTIKWSWKHSLISS